MSPIILFFLVIVAVLVILSVLKTKTKVGDSDQVWPFYPKKPLSQPEQIFYFRLKKALPDHIVLAQVHLSRLLGVKKGNNFWAWYNRINRMSADFVVCNRDSSIVAVIELDDSSHEREDHKTTDTKKDKALSSAGIRIIRWQAKELPDEPTIKATLMPVNTLEQNASQAAISLT